MELQAAIQLVVSFTVIVVVTNLILKRRSKRASNLPPGPWKLPIIGNLHQLMVPKPPHQRLRELAKKYGPVMHLQLGEAGHVVVSSAEAAKEVLKTHDAAIASRPFILAANIIYNGGKGISFTPYGDYWKLMRKVATSELLSNTRVLSYRSIREEELSHNLVARLTNSTTIDFAEVLFPAMNRVIARCAFGVVRENTKTFMDNVSSGSDFLSGFNLTDLYPSLKFLPAVTGIRAKVTRLHRQVDALIQEIVNEHKAARKIAAGKNRQQEADDLIDVLLNLLENCTDVQLESSLTDEHIKAVISELFLAASGTLAVTMEWTMSELMKNPRVLQKAQEEIRQMMSAGKKKVIEEQGLDDLKYMNAVIKEALRLHPAGPLLVPRESIEDVVIDGYMIPTGTRVMINVWAIGRDPSYWDDPETFYPERFLDCTTDFKGRDFEFIPFGAGRRMCSGMAFGVAIVQLALANLLYHFDWKLPGGMKSEDLDMSERFGITLRRKTPLCLIPVAYNSSVA
ncbi:Cytochrome P450 71D8 [Linum grandiflorum]